MGRNFIRRFISFLICICLICTTTPGYAFAVESGNNSAEDISTIEENETVSLSLLNHDGTEIFATVVISPGSILSQSDIDQYVDRQTSLREAYKFIAWSLTMGDVADNYTPTASFTIDSDTILYAVYRPVKSSDIDTSVAIEMVDTMEAFSEAASVTGLTIDDAFSAPVRSEEFYDLLTEYYDQHISEYVPAETMAMQVSTVTSSADTLDAQRILHAFEDATWSTSTRSDLTFAKEVVYMYTSHYIDVAEPFGGTFVAHDSTTYQLYITDLDRRTYETYYSGGSAVETYSSILSLVAVLADAPGLLTTGTSVIAGNATKLEIVNGALTLAWDGYGTTSALETLTENAYEQICDMEYTTDEELFALIDALVEDIKTDISTNYGTAYVDSAMGIVLSALAFATGGGTIAILMPYVTFYNNFAKSIFDSAYYAAMRMYIQTRIGERMMFALGMSDGRN